MYRRPINLLNPQNPAENVSKETLLNKRRAVFFWIFGILSVVVLFYLTQTIRSAGESHTTLAPKNVGLFQTVKNFIFKPEAILEGQVEDRINILLLGIGGPGHDGPYLSDTNIILSLKPSTNEVAMISVPRDLGVKINNHGWRKINHANAFGEAESPGFGGEYAKEIFEKTFQIEIPYYIRVDFTAFSEIIDKMGGITVNVPRSFTDTAYPGPNFSFRTVQFAAGVQTMNGEQALTYARSRHGNNGEGSDFARAKRQQLILEALKDKMLSIDTLGNPVKWQGIYSSLNNHITTNLNFAQLAYLGSTAKDAGDIKSLVLDNSPGGFLVSTTGESGAFLLSPKTGDFGTINTAITQIFDQTTTTPNNIGATQISNEITNSSSSPKIEVKNGTWIPGLAARIGKKLDDQGMRVLTVGNSLKRPIEHTVIYVLSETDPLIVKKLSEILKAANTKTLPDWLLDSYDNPSTSEDETGMKYNKDADILIILGTDTKE